jgi:hypothetical protein
MTDCQEWPSSNPIPASAAAPTAAAPTAVAVGTGEPLTCYERPGAPNTSAAAARTAAPGETAASTSDAQTSSPRPHCRRRSSCPGRWGNRQPALLRRRLNGSGSSRHSPRNRFVATILNRAGFGTLLT